MEFGLELRARVKRGVVTRRREGRVRVKTGGDRRLHVNDVEALLRDAVEQLLVGEVHARPLPLVGFAAALEVEPGGRRDMGAE
jgi:hypothetical protein